MRFLFTLLFVSISSLLYSQQTIKGTAFDNTEAPIVAAVVSLLESESKVFVKLETTAEDGTFVLKNIPNGSYLLELTSLGFKDYLSDPIEVNGKDIVLDAITLKGDSVMLDVVTVAAEKPMVQVFADKTVFNVQNNISTAGNSGFELLRKAPGVIIDNNDNLIVEGKTGVQIYIDDKPSTLRGEDLVNYLKTIQAEALDAVEIITQPSSKYDAEGSAGIINIRFKRDKSLGAKGSISTGLTYGDFARVNTTVSLNYRSKKTNLFGTLSTRHGSSFNFINLNRFQEGIQYDSKSENVTDFKTGNLRLGLDVYVGKSSTIGVLFSGNLNDNLSERDARTPITFLGSSSPDQELVAGGISDTQTNNLYGNLNYRFKNKENVSFNVDLDYGRYTMDRENVQPNQYFVDQGQTLLRENIAFMNTPIAIDILTAKFDYEQTLLKGQFAIGTKFSNIVTDNQFDFYDRIDNVDVLNEDRTNQFKYDESISAAYFNYNRQLEKMNYQFGLRMEYTSSDGILTSSQDNQDDRVTRKYTNWFPSAGITYQFNPMSSLALNYSKRVRRPNYQSLNPFEYIIDELSFSKGNPFLQPQFTDNIKLSHTYNYRLNTSITYSFVKDYSAQVTEAVEDGRNFLNPRNVANNKIINLGISYPTSFTDWWSIYLSVNAYRSIFDATNEDFLPINQNTLSFYAQNTLKLPKGFSAEVSGWYSSPSIWGGTYQTQSIGSLNLAFQKKFLNDNLNVRLGFNDILFTSPWRGVTEFGALNIIGTGGNDSRQVQFNISYNFGNNEVKASRRRTTGIEDEKGRL